MPSNKSENISKKSKGKQTQGRTHQLQTPAPSDGGHSPRPESPTEPPESSKDAESRQNLQKQFDGSKNEAERRAGSSSAASEAPATPATPVPPSASADPLSPVTPSASAVPLSPVARAGPSRRHVTFERDPSHPQDYAPGEVFDDRDSNTSTDSEFEVASLQDVPTGEAATGVPAWVKQLIRNESRQHEGMDEFFNSDNPNYDESRDFFVRLNQQIRAINIAKGVNPDIGTIPDQSYAVLCKSYRDAMRNAMAKNDPMKGWQAWHKTKDLLKEFNKRHYLPRRWNLSEGFAQSIIGIPNPRTEVDSETSNHSVDLDYENDTDPHIEIPESITAVRSSSLDALEARARQQQRQLTSAKVMYWWPKGTGTQIFVRYGDRATPIYRIRAGSHESYSRSQVERVLITKTRGTAKVLFETEGVLDEGWKWERRHVEDFIGVGWKVEDDDESDIDALSLILPEKGVVYPQTRTLVKWKDGVYTLEGRAFIRRVISGSSLDGDKVLYQKAQEMESAYRTRHGIDVNISSNESDTDHDYISGGSTRGRDSTVEVSDSSDDTERRRNIRTGKRAMGSGPLQSATKPTYLTTDEEEDGTSTFTRRRRAKQRENFPRKSQPLPRRRGSRPSTAETDTEKIRQLEEELRKLKTGRSKTQSSSRATTPAHSGSWSLPPARRRDKRLSEQL